MADAFPDLAGQGLTFAVSGPGVTVDPVTGMVAIPSEALAAGIEVEVSAPGAGGAAGSRFRLTVAPAAPAAVPPALVTAPSLRGTGVIGAMVEVDPGQWSGQPAPEVTLAWRAGGAAIPGASGPGFVPTAAEDGLDLDCLVMAANAAGSAAAAAGPLRVTEVAPAVAAAFADLTLTQGAAAGRVETAGHFTGGGLRLTVAGAGAEIDAAGVILLPTDVILAEEPVVVTAQNSGGAATAVFRISVTAAPVLPAAPVALGVLPDLVLEQGTGERTVSAQAGFAGEGLSFALASAPAGVAIESGSGLVRIPTDTLIPAAGVRVRAMNAGGTAEQVFTVTVRSTVSDFAGPGALADLTSLHYVAPVWSQQPEGFARLVPATGGRVHSAWSKAAGDGRYRCLARWSAAAIPAAGARPFSFNARLSKVKPGWAGLKVDALQSAAGERSLEIAQYVSGDTKAVVLGAAAVGWQWDSWCWVEVELDGAAVRARLYPEAATPPDWQATGTATLLDTSGAFGPGGFPLLTGGPNIDIRRLEFVPLVQGSESVPPAAADADWGLGQFTESK